MPVKTVGLCITVILWFGLISPADSAPATAPSGSDDVLLNAINFALTGFDGIEYRFIDRPGCIVSKSIPSTQPGVQAVETFYLNNIDASRIRLQKMQETSQYDTTPAARIELHGESVVRENAFDPQPPNLEPMRSTNVTLTLNTGEYDRLARAWRYIYAHGCKSAKSSF